MSDNEENLPDEQQPVHLNNPVRERVVALLGKTFDEGKIDDIVFDIERLADSKPAVLFNYGPSSDVTMEKLERLAPQGLCIVEIVGQKLLVNLDLLDRRMPWGPDAICRLLKMPLIIDVSPNLASPRFLNAHDLPDDGSDTRSNSNLFFMTEDIVDMMREIRMLIADGERVIEKQKRWNHVWCPRTVFGCLSGNPVVFWSDTEDRTLGLEKGGLWRVQWIDGERKRPVYSFYVPHPCLTPAVKTYIQQWTDRIYDRSLPHQNYFLLFERMQGQTELSVMT